MKAPYLPEIIPDNNLQSSLPHLKSNFPIQSGIFKDKQVTAAESKYLVSLADVQNKSDIAFMRKDILVQQNSKESNKKRELVLKTKNRKFSILGI